MKVSSKRAALRHGPLVSSTTRTSAARTAEYLLIGLGCGVPVLLYIVLASRALLLPGVYYDEVLQAVPALAALNGDLRSAFPQVNGSVIRLAGHPFPLFILPYLGSTQAAALAAVFAVAGVSVEVMRMTFIILGAIPLICTFCFMRRLFNTRTACIAILLLATDPTYIFSARSDNGPTVIMMSCKMAALWLAISWWQTRRPTYLLVSALLCGIGVYDKVNFVWFLGAFAVALISIYPGTLRRGLQSAGSMLGLGVISAFGIGALPQILYSVWTGGGPFRALPKLAAGATVFGVNNTDIVSNLLIRMQTLIDLLQGYAILDFYTSAFGGYHYPYARSWFPMTALLGLLLLGLVVSIAQAVLRANWGVDIRKALLLLLTGVLIVGASTVTPTNLMYHHVLIAYPFFHLFVAQIIAVLPQLVRALQPKRRANEWLARGIIGATLALALVSNLGVVGTYYRVLDQTGGIGMWSDGIYHLADYLHDDQRTIQSMDWGIHVNLLYLSQGRIHSRETFAQFIGVHSYSAEMQQLIAQSNQVFVFHAPRYSGIYALVPQDDPRETFFQTANALKATITLEKTIYQRNGDRLFEIYTVAQP
jgi:4-amino-4-deoxy-L-arabinose transferase-like glycosyltransferase